MDIKLIFVLSTCIGLTACASNSALPKITKNTSVITYTNELENSTSSNLDKLVVHAGKLFDNKNQNQNYKTLSTFWCPNHVLVRTAEDVINRYKHLCELKGGNFSSSFCSDKKDDNNVLFYARVVDTGECTTTASAQVDLAEPIGNINNPSYTSYIKSRGYITKEEKEETLKKINQGIKRRKEQLNKKMHYKRNLMTEEGTRICHQTSGTHDNSQLMYQEYIASIEQVAKHKIKIQINKANNVLLRLDNNEQRKSSLRYNAQLQWVSPNDWFVCE